MGSPYFKMTMGSKEKDTPGSMSEKQSGILKSAPMYKYADGPLTKPGDMYASESANAEATKASTGDSYESMSSSFDSGKSAGEKLVGKKNKKEDASKEDASEEE